MNDTPEITAILYWIRQNVPGLLVSGENWQIVLHGRNDGHVNAEIKRNSCVVPAKKEARILEERRNGR